MTLAMRRLKNIGWFALVFMVTILLYPLSLNVAAVHSDLMQVDQKIRDTKREISFLQAELRTRASLQQLEEWNDLLYGYKPPTAEQFIEGENALAGLGGNAPTIKPVMVAVASGGTAPAGVIGSAFAPMNPPEPAGPEPAASELAAATPVRSRTDKLAGMDSQILSGGTLRAIEKAAVKEQGKQ